jgi:hypothetical protein
VNPHRIHSTVTHVTDNGWGFSCEDCPAKADGYRTKTKASRVAAIHADPSRTHKRRTPANH